MTQLVECGDQTRGMTTHCRSEETIIVKGVEQCLGEAEKEIVRSRERLDKQGPSTSNEPVARENTMPQVRMKLGLLVTIL